ncbi:MAG: helix-turn-helix domain-containing protein [Kofleriaceae bacterium]
MKSSRAYDGRSRAQQAAETTERVLVEAERLFATEPFDRATLDAVAQAAEVTIPTLQRRFGNKEGLFAACAARVAERVERQRGTPPVGSIKSCLSEHVAHYEREGAMMWHLLRQEADVPLLRSALAAGRARHRAWVKMVFARSIARVAARKRRARVDALVAVTDLFVWKLLRIDLGRGAAEVEALMCAMAEAVAGGG